MKYAIGDTICDDYVVKLPLGEGGMGEVYLVEHSGSGDLRAAKVMRIRDDASADDLAAFRQGISGTVLDARSAELRRQMGPLENKKRALQIRSTEFKWEIAVGVELNAHELTGRMRSPGQAGGESVRRTIGF